MEAGAVKSFQTQIKRASIVFQLKLTSENTNRSFLHDVKTAMLVEKNRDTAAMLVDQNNPKGIEFCFYENISFCFINSLVKSGTLM